MSLDATRVRDAFRSIHTELTRAEAGAIVDVARLAASSDGKVESDETAAVILVARTAYGMSGLDGDPPIPTGKIDAKRMADIGDRLERVGAREIAFAAALLITIQDVELTKAEGTFIARLAEALLIDQARAKALSKIVLVALKG